MEPHMIELIISIITINYWSANEEARRKFDIYSRLLQGICFNLNTYYCCKGNPLIKCSEECDN